MAGIGLEFDPTAEDSANVPLVVNDGVHYRAMKFEAPMPEADTNFVSSADTEGELPANLRYQNRKITAEWRVYGTSAANLLEELGKLEQKIGRVNTPNEQATLKWTSPSGTSIIFDLLEGEANTVIDNAALATNRAVVTASFTAKPFHRSGVEVEGSLHEETTLPVVIGVDTGLLGDVPPLGRLVISEKQGVDQWTAIWGTQSRWYDPSVDAELFYEAESRTPIGSSEKKAGPSGASGAGENTIFNGSLIPSYQGIVSTQKAAAGNHLRHIGAYRVFAHLQRPSTNTGSVSVALSWAQGDFLRYTTNEAKTWAADELEGVWTFTNLGLVRLTKVTAGTQRWEGRMLAKSTVAGDDIYVDYLVLVPVDEGYGELKIEPSSATPTTLSAHDEFDQSAGALSGVKTTNGITAITAANPGVITSTAHGLANGEKVWIEGVTGTASAVNGFRTVAGVTTNTFTAGVNTTGLSYTSGGTISKAGKTAAGGGAWYGTGDTDDFSVNETSHKAERTATSDSSITAGRFALLPEAGELATVSLSLEVSATSYASKGRWGVVARYIDVNNWVAATLSYTVARALRVDKCVAGVVTSIGFREVPAASSLTFTVAANGAWVMKAGGQTAEGQDPALASGGSLATGRVGIYDAWTVAAANTRTFDNFSAFGSTSSDAAIFASKQAEVRWDRMQRQDSGGTLWVPRSDYKGSYFRPPPARREARSNRTIVKLSRYNTDTMQDAAIDDAAFRVFWQARGLLLPES